ncbi:threonine/serine exporter family protein [Blastococcus montanus]|uniref:threonine/serine ThrE exporter family protein n=1 Tax=Blastococcus montanus TaxID=3144973 RepID=UPI0032091DA4
MVAGRRRGGRRRDPAGPPEPVHLPEPEEREAYRILDFALRAGEVLLSGGAAASDVTAATIALARACGLRGLVSEVTFTSITMSYLRAPDVAPVTSVRLVQERNPDYTRVTEIHNLVDDVVSRRIGLAEAVARLEAIESRRPAYRRWAITGFRALLGAGFAVLIGAGLLVTVIAFVTTVLVDRTTGALVARRLPDFYANVVGAAIATAVAMAVTVADLGVRPSLIVASGIVLLLPGVTLVGAVQDAINGFVLTASARAFEVFILTAGIVSGVAAVLSVADRAGVALAVAQAPAGRLGEVPVQLVAAVIAAAAAAAANYAPRRTLPAAGLAGALGWGAFRGLGELGLDPALSTGAAAVLVGAGAYLLAHRQKASPLIYIAAGIIPLLPGLLIYRGMLFLAAGDTGTGLVLLSQATTIGLALAAGVILGEFLARPAPGGAGRRRR